MRYFIDQDGVIFTIYSDCETGYPVETNHPAKVYLKSSETVEIHRKDDDNEIWVEGEYTLHNSLRNLAAVVEPIHR